MNRVGCLGCGCDERSAVDVAALAQAQHQHAQYLVFDLTNHLRVGRPPALQLGVTVSCTCTCPE